MYHPVMLMAVHTSMAGVKEESTNACFDIACMNVACFCRCLQKQGLVCVQAEMSEDEGHSQAGSDEDADEDGDLVSTMSLCGICPTEYELALAELSTILLVAHSDAIHSSHQLLQA